MGNKGSSEAIGALIVGVSVLTVALISAQVAQHLLVLEVAKAEFEEAMKALATLADIVEEVGIKTLSSGHVKINCQTGRLDFIKDGDRVQLILYPGEGGSPVTLIDAYTASIRYVNPYYSYGEEYVRGGSQGLVMNGGEPLVTVETFFQNASIVKLYSHRVRLVSLGATYLENTPAGPGYVNVFEAVFIRLTIGQTFGLDSIRVVASSGPASVKTVFVNTTSLRFELLVNEEVKDAASINGPSTVDGAPVIGSLIYVVEVEVKLSTV